MTSTMSWLDTAGLARFAKSALKEAQKTLDKALDIKEEDINQGDAKEIIQEKESIINDINVDNTWGSFTGSYFDVKKSGSSSESITPKSRSGTPIRGGQGDAAPLATPEQGLTPVDNVTGFPSKYTTAEQVARGQPEEDSRHAIEKPSESAEEIPEEKVRIRPKARRNSANRSSVANLNRLSAASVLSNESEHKSSESVEVLGSQSAATSPESAALSVSSSIGLPASCTDSVEVIGSTASVSSIEVIHDLADISDGCATPSLQSPGWSISSGIEVIEDVEEDDSYTSMSESTGTTMMSHLLRSGASTPDVLKLSMPSQGSCDLLCESIQEVDWESPETSQHEAAKSVHSSPIRRILSKSEDRLVKLDQSGRNETTPRLTKLPSIEDESLHASMVEDAGEGERDAKEASPGMFDSSDSQSDCRTAVDSSCEGTIMGSSSEDCTVVKEVSEVSESPDQKQEGGSSASSSVYMKELLAEAIKDDISTRETSPTLSDKSKSDLVKVGSAQNSGHTSGDELETNASSDIEIISRFSPNGDSSSTTSRYSPAKLGRQKFTLVNPDGRLAHKARLTHQRVPSEASSACSEDSPSEADRLSRKIQEMTEVLEAREAKLGELSRTSHELQERNLVLKKQLETASKPQDTACEKDELIRDLREEGEKLSLMQLKQSNIIKTLRKQEQSQQIVIASYKKQVENLTKELDALKEKLASKEETERSQTEQIRLMTGKVVRQDKEISTLMDQLEQAVIKAEQLRINLDSAEQDLQKKTSTVHSLERELRELSQAADAAKRDKERIREREREREALIGQLEELRQQIKQAEMNYQQKESNLREEKKSLLRRLEQADGRNEELTQSVSLATRPLLKQLDQLQNSCNQQRDAYEQREKQLLDRIEEMMVQEASAKEIEKSAKLEVSNMRSRVSAMEAQLSKGHDELVKSRIAQDDLHGQLKALEEELIRLHQQREQETASTAAQLREMQQRLSLAEEAATAANQRAATAESAVETERVSSPLPSPTLSFGKMSMSGSEWQIGEDAFDTSSVTGRNLYDSMRAGSTTVLEGLQAQLKMRDGETMQLQWELQRRDAERSALTAELTSLTASLAEREEAVGRTRQLERSLAELQRNYDALLQMHGEKVEEVEELRLDLQDVKEMYKAQIDQLLGKNNQGLEPPG